MNLTFLLVCRWVRGKCSGLGVSGLNGGVMVIPLTDMKGKCIQDCGWGVGDSRRVRKMDVGICWILYIFVWNTYGCWDFKN